MLFPKMIDRLEIVASANISDIFYKIFGIIASLLLFYLLEAEAARMTAVKGVVNKLVKKSAMINITNYRLANFFVYRYQG